ncbi:hypothetical protein IOD16_06830 [Saccharothrix sp. 6-C]|uniref:GAP1-N2 domain-containing protein n=1 Tax=Saccharothrix sp. 6-C TaxID=2781735 RepID=UPI0019177912|nr:hypothetical protein [Saccharothrix sp. 6-C]QQQ78180.1 hypothetical protein IOD16_06830 [Saccharothrix sp. 6-C]
MAVRQLHYTSCEDGLEGIQGFQVSAMTPGTPRPLVELAVRASAYEPGPGLVGRLHEHDLSGFPVAFGYAATGRGAAVFQSQYTGADFTGRMGNYFAHALLFDDVERELVDVLPIDLWRSRAWVNSRINGSALPELTSLTPGDEANEVNTRRFVTAPGGTDGLEQVISGIQRALTGRRGRLVLVVPDDRTAALWVAAACRSFPHPLCLDISFTTYTARPEESGALLSCTTPDVRLPAYGDFTTIDLTTRLRRDPNGTRYASAIGQLWERGAVASALAFANQVEPRLTVAELDTFAVLLEMSDDLPVGTQPDEEMLLAAVRLVVGRLSGGLPAHVWQRIGDAVQDAGGPADVVAWSEVLRTARQRGEPVPAKLFGTYFIAALGSQDRLWLPELSQADLDDIAENVVLPSLRASPPDSVVQRLCEQRPLLGALARVLELKLANQDETARLAAKLPSEVARALEAGASERVKLLVDLVLVRSGDRDPVQVVTDPYRRHAVDWRRFGSLLWPQDPSPDEAVRLLRQMPASVVIDSGLGMRIVARALDLASRDGLGAKDAKLVDELLNSPIAVQLERTDRAGLDAARRIAYFQGSTPGGGSVQVVLSALEAAGSADRELGRRLIAAAAAFVLRADNRLHRDLLDAALGAHAAVFLPAYRDAAREYLAGAQPRQVAAVIAAWRGLAGRSTRDSLIEETLAQALLRRRRKHLDKIGAELKPMADMLDVSTPKPNWNRWWQSWRGRHERRGPLSFFRRREV